MFLDWILAATTCSSLWFISKKRWYGWMIALLNNAVLFPILNVHVHNYGLLILDVVTTIISARALVEWRRANSRRFR